MSLAIITLLIFVVILGLMVSAIYFFVEAPASRKQLRTRLAAVRQASTQTLEDLDNDTLMMREDLFRDLPFLSQLLVRFPGIAELHLMLDQAAIQMRLVNLLLIVLGLAVGGLVFGLLFGMPTLLALVTGAFLGAIPFFWVAIMRRRRFNKFEELFPDAMDLLARAVRAGHAFTSGLDLIATEMPEPVATEFRIVYDQQNLGLPMKEALNNLTVRVPLSDVRVFVTSLQIQRESGGNLAEILDNLSTVVRERFKIYRQIRTYAAQGRLSMYVLMAMPPATAVLMYLSNPEYLRILFEERLGHFMLIGAVVSQLIGYFVIRKIIQIKV
ncbi:MAG TPA: type II secretion system F family protein [Acidobacteriota bacterium]|nr:type II secretion system F family protein [Acidobacteriota bacterium]